VTHSRHQIGVLVNLGEFSKLLIGANYLLIHEDKDLGRDRFPRTANFSNLNIYGFLIVFVEFLVFKLFFGAQGTYYYL
jgi:hypothetical protein